MTAASLLQTKKSYFYIFAESKPVSGPKSIETL